MRKYRLTFVIGFVLIVYHLSVQRSMGDLSSLSYEQWQRYELLGALRYVVIIACVFLTTWMHSRSSLVDSSFKALFFVGLGSATILAHFVGVYEFLFMYWNPSFVDVYMKAQQEHAVAMGQNALSLKQTAPNDELMHFMKMPLINGIFYFVETLLLGLITSAISALSFRERSKNIHEGSAS